MDLTGLSMSSFFLFYVSASLSSLARLLHRRLMGQHTFYCILQFHGCGGPLLWRIKNSLSTAADRKALLEANDGKDPL